MQKITLIRGGCYIGKGYHFNNGDFADVSKEDAEYFLTVTDAKGRNRFKAGVVLKEDDTSERGDLTLDDVVPATNQGIKDRLDELKVEYPATANKEQLTVLFTDAIAAKAVEGSEDVEADEDEDADANDPEL